MRSKQRLFSLSAQLALDRCGYYAQLQAATGQSTLDITPWVQWFTGKIEAAFDAATGQMQTAMARSRYWAHVNAAHPDLSASQRKALARLLDAQPEGFAGGMSTEKYVNLTGASRATAYRELTQLAEYGLIEKTGQAGGALPARRAGAAADQRRRVPGWVPHGDIHDEAGREGELRGIRADDGEGEEPEVCEGEG